jgi:predicted RNA-binding Zn-ribbon protein involved in translation (DUF1610 family)
MKETLRAVSVECPECRRESLVPREKWPGKRSSEPVPCFKCGWLSEARGWTLLSVPYMWLEWSA